jgi:hypothetical protein
MPEPSNSKINSSDSKYGNGSKSAKAPQNNVSFAGTVATVADQQKERDRKLKAAAKIDAPKQYIVRTMHSEENNADGTTKKREW